MIVPNAEMIEAANDQLTKMDVGQLAHQRVELVNAVGAVGHDFMLGYELGLQTARVFLEGYPAALPHGVAF